MPAYLIVDTQPTDDTKIAEYRKLSTKAVEAAGGRFIVRGGQFKVVEGDWKPSRIVVVEFPSYQAALAFYDGGLYRAARAQRAGASAYFNAIIVEGAPQ